jgi:cytoskeletal protein RodZ
MQLFLKAIVYAGIPIIVLLAILGYFDGKKASQAGNTTIDNETTTISTDTETTTSTPDKKTDNTPKNTTTETKPSAETNIETKADADTDEMTKEFDALLDDIVGS